MVKKQPAVYDLQNLGESITIPIPIEKPGERSHVYFKIFQGKNEHIHDHGPVKHKHQYAMKFVFIFGPNNFQQELKEIEEVDEYDDHGNKIKPTAPSFNNAAVIKGHVKSLI